MTGKLTYTLSGTDGGSFTIDRRALSGQLLTKRPPWTHATEEQLHRDGDCHGPVPRFRYHHCDYHRHPSSQSRNRAAMPIVAAAATAVVEAAGGSPAPKPTKPEPEFDANGPVTITVPENTEDGTDIGDPLTASDDDDTVLNLWHHRLAGWFVLRYRFEHRSAENEGTTGLRDAYPV